jgi:hypothetical protein
VLLSTVLSSTVLSLVLAVVVSGCGFDPRHAPADAKPADFCSAWARLATAGASTSAQQMTDYLNELARFGTPQGIPTTARRGFEYVIDPAHAFGNGQQFQFLANQQTPSGLELAALQQYAQPLCTK